jgi:hypothetical protein
VRVQQLVASLKDLLAQRDRASTTFQALLDMIGQNGTAVSTP